MFLSFIVPVYNAGQYIEECLLSLISQDLSPDEFEIICVDDGSEDDSKAILDSFANKFDNVVVCSQVNAGVSTARNCGINEARGDYIWFVDGDDFIAKNILGHLKNIAYESNADRIRIESYSFNNKLNPQEQEAYLECTIKSNVPYKAVMATRTLYKRSYLLENNIKFIVGVHYGEDGVFNYQTLIHNPVTVDSNILGYFYRTHSLSVTNINEYARAEKCLMGTKAVFDILTEDYNNRICLNETRRMLLYWMYSMVKNYYLLGDGYFAENFTWEYELKNIPLRDYELRKMDRFLRKLSGNGNYRKLASFFIKQKRRDELKMKSHKLRKKIVYCIKHPKRFLKSLVG